SRLQRNPHDLEVTGADDVAVALGAVGGAGGGAALDRDADSVPVSGERERARDGRSLDARDRRRAGDQLPREGGLRFLRVPLLGGVGGEGQEIPGPDAGVDAWRALEAPREQARQRRERQRQRELRDREAVAETVARRAAARAPRLLEVSLEVLGG